MFHFFKLSTVFRSYWGTSEACSSYLMPVPLNQLNTSYWVIFFLHFLVSNPFRNALKTPNTATYSGIERGSERWSARVYLPWSKALKTRAKSQLFEPKNSPVRIDIHVEGTTADGFFLFHLILKEHFPIGGICAILLFVFVFTWRRSGIRADGRRRSNRVRAGRRIPAASDTASARPSCGSASWAPPARRRRVPCVNERFGNTATWCSTRNKFRPDPQRKWKSNLVWDRS